MAVRVERVVIGVPPLALVKPEVQTGEQRTDFERGVYGEKHIERLYVDDLVMLTQVRNAPNLEADRLKESIANNLINQIDVARMTPETFIDYVDFVNDVWGVDNDPEAATVSDDGFIYLVVAGHTRLEAIRHLEADRPADLVTEYPLGAVIDCKVHPAMTPQEIIVLQLDENIYRQPTKERQAMAIVETYYYGLRKGQWQNKAEFLNKNKNRFGHAVLDDAISFANLPADIRDFIMTGGISYRAGVELGKILPTYCEYVLAQYFAGRKPSELAPAELQSLESGIMEWLGAEVAHIQDGGRQKFNTTTLRSRYKAYAEQFLTVIQRKDGEEADGQQFVMTDPTVAASEWRLTRRRVREEYKRLLQRLAAQPLETASELVNMHLFVLGRQASEDLPDVFQALKKDYIQRFGGASITGAGIVELPS